MTTYTDRKGRLIFVAAGIGGDTWGTFYKASGKWHLPGIHRVKSRLLPMRSTKEQALADFAEYARRMDLMATEVAI